MASRYRQRNVGGVVIYLISCRTDEDESERTYRCMPNDAAGILRQLADVVGNGALIHIVVTTEDVEEL